jgi:hypothetical protein
MEFTTEQVVRTLVGVLLRTDPWAHKFLCSRCLLGVTLEQSSAANRGEQGVRRALESIFRTPGALMYVPAFPCAKCQDVSACLSAR